MQTQAPAALLAALDDPGFTPGRRHLAALLDLLGQDQATAERAEKALLRAGAAALPAALARAAEAGPPLRAALTRLVGRLAAAAGPDGRAGAEAFLLGRLRDEDARSRRMAAVALGKLRDPSDATRGALAAAARAEAAPDVRRALAAALGKVGGERAHEALEALGAAGTDSGELTRLRARATLMLQRTASRGAPSSIAAERAPERPARVAARCRRGLEPVLADELAALDAGPGHAALRPEIRNAAPGRRRVEVTLAGPLERLLRSRTWLSVAFALPVRSVGRGGVTEAVVEALASPEAAALLRRFTVGAVRYRLAWAEGGKRRAAVWDIAGEVQRRAPGLINDPTGSTWDVVIYEADDRVRVELSPRVEDARFAYRRGDVPAASHPTLAAALARVGAARADDVVWDPFVGSGLELCERARLGPYRRLVGSDHDARALEVARWNLDAAGAGDAELHERDACEPPPGEAPTLILTNPPMGRRVHRARDLGALLERFVASAARALAPGGRLVWASPAPERTAEAARRAGLVKERGIDVDMGGFDAQIQVLRRPEARRAPRPGGSAGPDRRREDERVRRGREDVARRRGRGRGAEQAEPRGEKDRAAREQQDDDERHDKAALRTVRGRRHDEVAALRGERGRLRRP